MMDGDNIALRDPETLFDAEDYVRTGSLLRMDFWRGSSAPDCPAVLGNATKLYVRTSPGRCWCTSGRFGTRLGWRCIMNSHSDFFTRLHRIHGTRR